MLTERREVFFPFQYDWAYQFWLQQQQSHWLHTEINLDGDVQDWHERLTPGERNVVTNILKLFTQMEVNVGEDYWGNRVAQWFPVHEVVMMAASFANMETIHAVSYNNLNNKLGLPESEYSAFLKEPTMLAKLAKLDNALASSPEHSLAVFSGFTEGVVLYSSFAVLLSFSLSNKLKGVASTIAFSMRDESLHSTAGCRLFREHIAENPHLWTDALKAQIYQSARDVVELEDAFIDKVFELGDLEKVSKEQLKKYIRHRTNIKLGDLGLKANYDNVEDHGMGWVDSFSGVEHQDFFTGVVTEYGKGLGAFNPSDMF